MYTFKLNHESNLRQIKAIRITMVIHSRAPSSNWRHDALILQTVTSPYQTRDKLAKFLKIFIIFVLNNIYKGSIMIFVLLNHIWISKTEWKKCTFSMSFPVLSPSLRITARGFSLPSSVFSVVLILSPLVLFLLVLLVLLPVGLTRRWPISPLIFLLPLLLLVLTGCFSWTLLIFVLLLVFLFVTLGLLQFLQQGFLLFFRQPRDPFGRILISGWVILAFPERINV